MTLQKTGLSFTNFLKSLDARIKSFTETSQDALSGLNQLTQPDSALNFLANRFAEESSKIGQTAKSANAENPSSVLYKISIKMPDGKDELEYDRLEKAVIKTVFSRNGITLSRAALEDVAEKVKLDFTPSFDRRRNDFIYNPKNGLMSHPTLLEIDGTRSKGYEFKITTATEKVILEHSKLAQEITASGRKAFSELTGEERLKMMIERSGKYLPHDTAEALKLVDPRSIVAGVMVGATATALVKRGIITSSGLAMLGGAVSLAQLLKYGGDAHHVLDLVAQAKKPEDLDKAAQSLAELAQNGAMDLFMTVGGFGAAKIAPKVGNLTGKAATIATEYADDIARISKQKLAEFKGKIENLKNDLPVVVTTNEGIPVVTTPNKLNGKGSNVVESRAVNHVDRTNEADKTIVKFGEYDSSAGKIKVINVGDIHPQTGNKVLAEVDFTEYNNSNIDILVEGAKSSTKGRLIPKAYYENPGHHDPILSSSGRGSQKYNNTKSILPKDHIELFKHSKPVMNEEGKTLRFALDSDGNIHRFEPSFDNIYHWSGASNGKTSNNVPVPLNVKNLEKIRKILNEK